MAARFTMDHDVVRAGHQQVVRNGASREPDVEKYLTFFYNIYKNILIRTLVPIPNLGLPISAFPPREFVRLSLPKAFTNASL